MFNNCNSNLKLCCDVTKDRKITSYFTNYENNCDELCYKDNFYYCYNNIECPSDYGFFITEKNLCVKSCTFDSIYKYEFEDYCYDKCPKGTHSTDDNIYLCEKNSQSIQIKRQQQFFK